MVGILIDLLRVSVVLTMGELEANVDSHLMFNFPTSPINQVIGV